MKIWPWALGIVVLCLVVLGLSAPSLAKSYVLQQHPEIKQLDSISWGWSSTTLKDVVVEKGRYSLAVSEIEKRGDTYFVRKGHLTIAPGGGGSTGAGPDSPNIKYEDLEVHATKSGWSFVLEQASGDLQTIEFKGGRAEKSGQVVHTGPGKFQREPSNLHLDWVETTFLLPKTSLLPERGWTRIEGLDLKFEQQQLTAGRIFVREQDNKGKKLSTVLGLTVSLEGEQVLAQAADFVVEQHKWTGRLHIGNIAIKAPLKALTEKPQGRILLASNSAKLRIQPEKKEARFSGSCRDWAETLGTELPFEGNLSGSLSWGDKPTVKVEQDCKLACSGPPFNKLKKPFQQYVYKADNKTRYYRNTGPGTPNWIPLRSIPPYMATFVIKMEDPGFPSHKGVHVMALRNSLQQNLDTGRFVRGGSTLTMQLVRNLWLSRDKTLTRKATEILLAWATEKCLAKDEILGLYLNVVEFGPETYGIEAGSQYHFGHSAGLLTAEEAFFLASILPNPNREGRGKNRLDWARSRAERFIKSGWLDPEFSYLFEPPLGVVPGHGEEGLSDLEEGGLPPL